MQSLLVAESFSWSMIGVKGSGLLQQSAHSLLFGSSNFIVPPKGGALKQARSVVAG